MRATQVSQHVAIENTFTSLAPVAGQRNNNNNMLCFAAECCVDLFTWLLSVLGLLSSAQRGPLLLIVVVVVTA